MKHVFALIFAIYATFHLFVFNEYMHRQPVNVEVADKTLHEGSKHRIIHEIIYERADGVTFKRPVSEPEWQAALPGEKTRLYLRPFDMKQTSYENARYFFAPILAGAATLTYLLWFLFFGWPVAPKEKNIVTSETSGPF